MTAAGKLMVVEDDPAVARAIASTGEAMGLETAIYGSCLEFLEHFRDQTPGCIVLDVKMPAMTGMELLRLLRTESRLPPIIMVSGHGDIKTAVEALQLGAITFLEKPFSFDELSQHISAAFEAKSNISRADERKARARQLLDNLKPHEHELLELLIKGQSNKQMATVLGMSLRGVEDRRARIMKKLEAESLAELCEQVHLARDSKDTR